MNILNLLIVVVIIIAAILLQIFLSKKENKLLGFILPFLCFAYSLLMVFSLAMPHNATGWDIFALISSTFFFSNIPTIVLLGIYFGCREKFKQEKDLEKMSIQDLE